MLLSEWAWEMIWQPSGFCDLLHISKHSDNFLYKDTLFLETHVYIFSFYLVNTPLMERANKTTLLRKILPEAQRRRGDFV